MESYIVKNMIKNVLHFLEYNRSFVIQDDEHNCLDLFLVELNRLRQMLGLQPFVVERIIRNSNGSVQRQFSLSRPKDDADTTIKKDVELSIPPKIANVRVTKSKFKQLMEELFGDNITSKIESIYDEDLEKYIKETHFYIGDACVGRWSNNKGRYIKH
jgi:hypothetical protein